MRILLTGATGYIGLHLLKALLADGHTVTAVVRSAAKLGPLADHPRTRVVVADLEQDARLGAALPGHQVVIHAALIWGDIEAELQARDVGVACALFDAAGHTGVQRVIFLSSAGVHRPFTGEMDEQTALTTTDLYGASKAAGELFLRAACARHGMQGVVLRPGPVVGAPAFQGASFRGPRQVEAMVRAALEQRPIEIPAGAGRQFIAVDDLTRAICLLVETQAPEPTYICADAQTLSWPQVARMVVSCVGSSSEVQIPVTRDDGPPPRFATTRFQALLGAPTDATRGMRGHVQTLAATWTPA